ncbi:MAG TPA: ATP-binding protein [Burkholderiaceae bacterium]|nr:ATP-binding protein [Burkholderiaceae bacterium]
MVEVDVGDDSAVAAGRRRALATGAAVGLDELRQGQLAIVATELATNMLKHGGGGKLLVGDAEGRVDLLALDTGPGMTDVEQCIADGFSSAGTRGTGLGAVRRLAQTLHIASWPGRGTAVLASLGVVGDADGIGGLSVAKRGEVACGDAWARRANHAGSTLLVVDGLGHGADAALAAHEALRQFHRGTDAAPAELVQALHLAMRHTRGGAVGVARIESTAATVAFAGLGNIAAALVTDGAPIRRLVSLGGIAGHNARKVQAFEYPIGDGVLIMHSDGIGTGWTPASYPGFTRLHPLLLAGLLYRDFARGRDDATVVVARTSRP